MLNPDFRSPTMVAPSGPVADTTQRRDRVDAAVLRLAPHKIIPQFSASVWSVRDYLAGDDKERCRELLDAFNNGSPLIWAARGGYGVMRLLDDLERRLQKQQNAPVFVGFSDLTALFPLLVKSGIRAIHGPVLSQISDLYRTGAGGFDAFLRDLSTGFRHDLSFSGTAKNSGGTWSGTLWGGNLSLLAATTGTRHAPNYEGNIVFLEEVGESAYRIDRMLTQLELSGVFGKVRCVLVGDMGVKGSEKRLVHKRFDELEARWSVPIIHGLPVGHFKRNACLEVGRAVTVRVRSADETKRHVDIIKMPVEERGH